MATNLIRGLLQQGIGSTAGGGGARTKEVALPAVAELTGSSAGNGLHVFLDSPAGAAGNAYELLGAQRAFGSYAYIDLLSDPDVPDNGLRVTFIPTSGLVAESLGYIITAQEDTTQGNPQLSYDDSQKLITIPVNNTHIGNRQARFLVPSAVDSAYNLELYLPNSSNPSIDHTDFDGHFGNDIDILIQTAQDIAGADATADIYTNAAQDRGVRVTLNNPGGTGGNGWELEGLIGGSQSETEVSIRADTSNNQLEILVTQSSMATAATLRNTLNNFSRTSAEYFGGEDGSSTPFASLTFAQMGLGGVGVSGNQFSGGTNDTPAANSFVYDSTAKQITLSVVSSIDTLRELRDYWQSLGLTYSTGFTGPNNVFDGAWVTNVDGLNGSFGDFSGGTTYQPWAFSTLKEHLEALASSIPDAGLTAEFFGDETGTSTPFKDFTLADLGFGLTPGGNRLAKFSRDEKNADPINVTVEGRTVVIHYSDETGIDITAKDTLGDIIDALEMSDILSASLKGTDTRASLPRNTPWGSSESFTGGADFEIDLSGYALGPPTNTFGTPAGSRVDAETARNEYGVANPAWLAAYRGKLECWIALVYSTHSVFQALGDDGIWRDVTVALMGEKGDKGDFTDIGQFIKGLAIEGDTLVATVVAADGSESELRFEGVSPVPIFLRRMGTSVDTTFTEAEIVAGTTSMNEIIATPAQGSGVNLQYLGFWIPDDQKEVTSIAMEESTHVNRRYDWFGMPIPLQVGGVDGYVYPSTIRLGLSIIGGKKWILRHESPYVVYKRYVAYHTRTDSDFVASDFAEGSLSAIANAFSTDKRVTTPTRSENAWEGWAVPDFTTDILSIRYEDDGTVFWDGSEFVRQSNLIELDGINYKIFKSTQQTLDSIVENRVIVVQ